MSEGPRFNPGFEFLEDQRILTLDNLINEVLSFEGDPKDKQRMLATLEETWERIWREFVEQVDEEPEAMKAFLRFISYHIRLSDVGGYNLDRTWLGKFIREKSEEAQPYFDKYMPPAE